MLKKDADRFKKQQAALKLANQFTELPYEQRDFAWHPIDAVFLAGFLFVIVLFFI